MSWILLLSFIFDITSHTEQSEMDTGYCIVGNAIKFVCNLKYQLDVPRLSVAKVHLPNHLNQGPGNEFERRGP